MTGDWSGQRVLHVAGCLDDQMGGLQTAIVCIANAQASAGHEVTLLAGTRSDSEYVGLEALDTRIRVVLFPYRRVSGRFSDSRGLAGWLRKELVGFDVVHTHSMWSVPTYTAARMAISRQRRLVISPHGSLEPYDLKKHASAKRLLGPTFIRPLLRAASTVLCTTRREAEGMVTFGAEPRFHVIPIPAGRDVPPSVDPAEFRRRFGIPPGARLLLFLGRVDRKKGLPILIEALSRLRGPSDVRLMVAGAGDDTHSAELKAQAAHLGVAERVIFAGWMSGQVKADALHCADLFVLLSYNENYGISVIEAAQAGLPILLTTDVYASPELIEAGAAVACERDPVAAAIAIDQLLGDPDSLVRMRQRARHVADSVLDQATIQAKYSSMLTDLSNN